MDTARADRMSYNGYARLTTPHIDDFAMVASVNYFGAVDPLDGLRDLLFLGLVALMSVPRWVVR